MEEEEEVGLLRGVELGYIDWFCVVGGKEGLCCRSLALLLLILMYEYYYTKG